MCAFALKAVCTSTSAFSGVVLLATSATLCVSFAVNRTVPIVTAVEALHDLILRREFFSCMMNVIDVKAICNAFVCSVWIVHIYYDGMVKFYFVPIVWAVLFWLSS